MMRDKRKTKQYFEKYITSERGRAEKFKEKIALLKTQEQLRQCNGYMAAFEKNILTAEYSVGASKVQIAEAFGKYLDAIDVCGIRAYAEMIDALSLAILLGYDCGRLKAAYQNEEFDDGLVLALKSYLKKGMIEITSEKLQFESEYQAFLKFLTGKEENTSEKFVKYICNDWYASCSDMSWYGSHTGTEDTYAGYWCWLAAALLKMKGKGAPEGETEYIPVDLI